MTKYGVTSAAAYQIMWDRYIGAFANEMKSFDKAIENNEAPSVT